MHVEVPYVGIAQPLVETSRELVARMRPDRLVVLPYLLYAGRLLTNLAQQLDTFSARHPWIKTALAPHLGLDERLIALLDDRARPASYGDALLPSDTCQHPTAIPDFARPLPRPRAP